MKKVAIALSVCTFCVLSVCTIFVLSAGAQQQPKPYVNKQAPMEHWSGLLRLVETIPIPTEGYIDHLSYDLKNQHLFISGENNKKLVVAPPIETRITRPTTPQRGCIMLASLRGRGIKMAQSRSSIPRRASWWAA